MKNFLRLSALIIAVSTISSSASAITASATARVVTPLTLTETTPMKFGSFASTAASGTVDSATGPTGGATNVGSTTRNNALFTVGGENASSVTYNVTIPASVSLSNGAQTMSAALSVVGGATGKTLTAGSGTFNVNGVLTVAANQAAGDYTGTYSITVAY